MVDDFKNVLKVGNIENIDNSDIITKLKKSLADIDIEVKSNENE